MAIRSVVTMGFGNGTFNGSISEVVTRGYGIGEAVVVEEGNDPIFRSMSNVAYSPANPKPDIGMFDWGWAWA